MLSDPESKIIRAYGIFNESSPRGQFYGIPYPGTYIVDTKGVVVEKYFEDDYSQRYTAMAILTRQFGAAPELPIPQLAPNIFVSPLQPEQTSCIPVSASFSP